MNYYYVSYESIKIADEGLGDSVFGKMIIKADDRKECIDKFFSWIQQQNFYSCLPRLFFAVEEVTDPILV